MLQLESDMKTQTASAFRFETEGDTGFLILDTPGERVNILASPVMLELAQRLGEIRERRDLSSLVIISAKEGNFIAGAKIEEIESIRDPLEGARKAAMGQAVFDQIAALPQTTIAVVSGACVGGGLELVLACDFRLAHDIDKTRIGLPEVRLGIIPGFGGTQRLPRLIGIQRSLEYILTGKLVDAKRAYRSGIVDRVIPEEFSHGMLRSIAHAFAVEIRSTELRRKIERRRRSANAQQVLLEKNFVGRRVLFEQARKRVRAESRGHYPAPEVALEAVERGYPLDLKAGLAIEAELVGRVIASEVSKNLISVFYLGEEIKKDKGVPGYDGPLRSFHRIGVLGAGVMGGGIAQLMAHNHLPARLKDINYAAVAKGTEAAAKVFSESVKKRRMTPKDMHNKMGLITGSIDYSGFHRVDLVIEAIVENLDIKKKVFAEIDQMVPEHVVLASNTSSLPVTAMSEATKRPDKVCGLHFFNPVHRMPLVEVIRSQHTSDQTIASMVAFAKKIGKTPIVVKDAPGFLVNRILAVYLAEASRILVEGASIEHVDDAFLQFGMPMGPFNLMDEIGLDVGAKASHVLIHAFGERMGAAGGLDKMVAAGRLGKKNGKGFYIYQGKEKSVDPAVYSLFESQTAPGSKLVKSEAQERCVLLMINEAAFCLMEQIVRRPHDVDAGMIFGTGFPPFRGGLLRYADSLSSGRVVERLRNYADKFGERFRPADRLVEMAAQGRGFYS
ncbi:MAG: 3-hydroxyacyl-CoA dehydrogenase NAD-binding domain-containing protein [bacterium]